MAAYLALTSHWISQDKLTGHLALKSVLIAFHCIKKKHTGINMADTILELLDQANVTIKVRLPYVVYLLTGFTLLQISHFTLDNAKNNTVAMRELESLLAKRNVNFHHKNNHIWCYANIINICSSHIVVSITLTHKSYIPNLRVPNDSKDAACNDDNDDDDDKDDNDNGNELHGGDLGCDTKDLELGYCYDGGEHPWLACIKRNPLRRARRIIHLLCSSDQHREGFCVFIRDGNKCNWFTAKDSNDKHAPVQVPELQPLRDVKMWWDLVYMMLQHLRELRPVRSFHSLESGQYTNQLPYQ